MICAFPAGSGADVLVPYFAEKLRVLARQVGFRREYAQLLGEVTHWHVGAAAGRECAAWAG